MSAIVQGAPAHTPSKVRKGQPGWRKWVHFLAHVVLLVGGFVMIYPLIFSVLAGFFSKYEFVATRMGPFPWPKEPTLLNFYIAITGSSDTKIQLWFMNSLIRTTAVTAAAMLTSLLGGYAFGRLRWPGRDKVFLALLATQMIPGTVGFIPYYLELYRWPLAGGNNLWGSGGHGLYNSYAVYFLGLAAINIMGTFLVRQSLQSTPVELDEAARVDGAGTIRIIFTLLMPLQKPVLAYVAITTAIGTWNDWMTPFFFTSSEQYTTLPGAIARLTALYSASLATPNYPMIITLGLAVSIPCLILFAFFQRQIVEGLANTGIKG